MQILVDAPLQRYLYAARYSLTSSLSAASETIFTLD